MSTRRPGYMMAMMMMLLLVFFLVAATGCAGYAAAASSEANMSEASRLSTSYEGALDVTSQLALGTIRLEGAEQAVTQEQAESLLPLWQALQSGILQSEAEQDAVLSQIEGAMSEAQVLAIGSMQLTQEDLQAWAQGEGVSTALGSEQAPQSALQGQSEEQIAQIRERLENLSSEERDALRAQLGQQGGLGDGMASETAGASRGITTALINLLMERSGRAAAEVDSPAPTVAQIVAQVPPGEETLAGAVEPTLTAELAPTPAQAVEETSPPVLAPAPLPTATPSPAPLLVPEPVVTTSSSSPSTDIASSSQSVVEADLLNVRSGPGTAYDRIGQLEEGAEVEIVGRNEEGTWWQIAYPTGGEELAWVSADYIATDIDANRIPVVNVVPPPEPMPVVEPTSTGFTGKIVFQESSGGRIFTINADGSGLTYLTNGLDPAWSPDGSQVVFTRWEWDPPSIFVINADGSDERVIFPGVKAKGPQWSPDGSQIVFTSERTEPAGQFCFKPRSGPEMCMELEEDRWKITVLDLATGHTMDPATDPFSYAPSWSPDGMRLVYDGVWGLRPADPIEGHDQEAAYIDYDTRDMYPVWSPTSDRIAFMFRQHDHWEIYTVNADGSGRTRLTESPLFEPAQNSVAPEWSPDGEWIAFLTDRRGEWEVWVMRADGSEQQPLFAPDVLEGIDFHYEAQSEHVLDWRMP